MRTITSLKTGQARQTRQAIGARQADIAAGAWCDPAGGVPVGGRGAAAERGPRGRVRAGCMATAGGGISGMTLVIVACGVWLALSLLAAAAWAVVVPWIKRRGS